MGSLEDSKPAKFAWVFPALSLALFLGGVFLSPVASLPDERFTAAHLWGALLLFMYWLSSLVCWGRLITKFWLKKRPELADTMVLGSMFFGALAAVLGFLGLVRADTRALLYVVLFAGVALDGFLAQREHGRNWGLGGWSEAWSCLAEQGVLARVVSVLCALVLATFFIKASIPHFHSDPLYYHLVAPRLWFEAGRISFVERLPTVAFASMWEYLYLWPNWLFGGPEGRGLIETHLFAQWMTVALGIGGTALVIERLTAAFPVSVAERLLIVVISILPGIGGGVAWLAKNDWGMAFWIVAATWYLSQARATEGRARAMAAAGLALGFAATKPTLLPLIGALFLIWIIYLIGRASTQHLRNEIALFAAASLVGPAFVFIRNWKWTGNPLYPGMSELFPSPWLSKDLAATLTSVSVSGFDERLDLLVQRLKMLALHDPFVLGCALVGAFALVRSIKRVPFWFVAALGVSVAMLGLLGKPVNEEDGTLRLRWLMQAFILVTTGGLLVAIDLGRTWLVSASRALAVVLVLLLGARLAQSDVPWRAWRDVLLEPIRITEALREVANGGDAKAWLRINAKGDELVVSTGDPLTYYVSHLKLMVIGVTPALDSLPDHPGEALKALRALGAAYLLDTLYYDGRFWNERAAQLDALIRQKPESVVFQGRNSRLIDLRKLLLSSTAQPAEH